MEKMLNELNLFLADLNVFYRKLQNYHWNIQGKDFFITHTKLEEFYNEINSQIDEVAEFILIIGGQPLGTMKDYLQITKIKEAENKGIRLDEIFNEIINDYTELLKNAKDIKKEADVIQHYETSTFMDEFILNYGKKIWMLKQTVK